MVREIITKGINKGRSLMGGRQETIISAAFVMMLLVAVTKVSGVVKIHLFARFFGASTELDVFWAAFKVPDIIFNIVVVGTVNAALIPVFAEKLGRGKGSVAKLSKLFSDVLNLFALIFIVSSIFVFIFAPQLSEFISRAGQGNFGYEAQDFSTADLELMTKLMRIMVFSPIMLGISSVYTAGIQVNKRFLVPALAPFLYNIGIILGAIVFVYFLDMGVIGLSLGVVLGSALHLAVQIPLAGALGMKLNIFTNFLNKDVFRIIKLAFPRILSLAGEQVSIILNTVISIGLGEGALSAFQFATSLYQLPVQLIGATISQAALPTLSSEYQCALSPDQTELIKNCDKSKEGKSEHLDQFRRTFLKSLQQILFFILPAVVFVVILRLPIVRLVLGAGEFDWLDTVRTAWVLALFSLAIIGQAMVSLLIRAFYAMQDTIVPLVVSILSLVINIIGAIYLTNFFSHYYDWRPVIVSLLNGSRDLVSGTWGEVGGWFEVRNSSPAAVGGLAMSLGLALLFEAVVLTAILHRRIGILSWRKFWQPILKKLIAVGVMFGVMYSMFKLWDFSFDTSTVISIIGLTLTVGGVGIVVYAGACMVIDVEETDFFIAFYRRIWKKAKGILKHG